MCWLVCLCWQSMHWNICAALSRTRRSFSSFEPRAGKMASDNLAQLAARMMESVFGNHMRIPALAPAQAPSAFVSCTRDPLLVAGFYRKLARCAMFFTS